MALIDYEATLAEADRRREAGKRDEAIRLYEAACAARPDRVYPLYWLATLFAETRDYERAWEHGQRGLAIDPDQIGLLLEMGTLAEIRRDPLSALELYERARRLDADIPGIDAKVAAQLAELGRADEAASDYARALAREPGSRPLHTARLFCLNLSDTVPRGALFEEHRALGSTIERSITPLPPRVPAHRPPVLRVGYVSPDLRAHGVPYFLLPLLASRSRDRFEHIVFDTATRDEDAFTERLRATEVRWHRGAGLDDASLARLIRNESIDVLVDLAGHTAGARLEVFAYKPAPVQATWLGYLGTTGLTRMDYRITDALMDPPGMTEHLHTERLWRLPVHACFAALAGAPAITPSPAHANGFVTFGCVNQWAKASPTIRATWAEILRRNPGARLCIVARGGQNPELQRAIVEELVEGGAERDQIRVYPFLETPEYTALLGRIDVALDPHPYGGGTTTFQCLWMGIPVVSLAGRSSLARNAVGPLHGVGLGDLVAASHAEYVAIASRLASDPERLRRERTTLRDRMRTSRVMDGPAFARDFEAACDAMLVAAMRP
ncbi:MAG: hypothetical protein U1F54_07190 [Burkholderiales bacterium]